MMTTILISWATLMGLLGALVKSSDELLKDESKKDIGAWLEGWAIPPSITKWPLAFSGMFDRIFTDKHLSWRCFFRSCIASLIAVLFFTILFYALDTERLLHGPAYSHKAKMLLLVFVGGILFNLLPDYLSLLETRYLLKWMARTNSGTKRAVLLLLDLVFTFGIFMIVLALMGWGTQDAFFRAVGLYDVYIRYDKPSLFSFGIYTYVYDFRSFLLANLQLRDVFGIFIYSTFATSFWLWLYLGAGLITKLVLMFGGVLNFVRRHFKISEKPILVIGFCTAIIQTAIHAFLCILSLVPESAPSTAKTNPLDRMVCPISGIRFVHIEAGKFIMGSEEEDWEQPVHPVNISTCFYLSESEVTQAQWQKVVRDNPSTVGENGDLPVENVSWNQVQEFIQELNKKTGESLYMLPSEAQWEYACRAGSTGKFHCPEQHLNQWAWTLYNSGGQMHTVKEKLPNPWGLYDMHGNVLEWVEDDYHKDYKGAPKDGNPWIDSPRGALRVFRGGSWCLSGGDCRSVFRFGDFPGLRGALLGVRLARACNRSVHF